MKILDGFRGTFSFRSKNKLVCYLETAKEKLEKLFMDLGVGELSISMSQIFIEY